MSFGDGPKKKSTTTKLTDACATLSFLAGGEEIVRYPYVPPVEEIRGETTMTHTYAILDVSPSSYREIRAALEAVGYAGHEDMFDYAGGSEIIRMGEFALKANPEPEPLVDLGLTPEEEAEMREEALRGYSEVLARMLSCWAKIRAKREIST